MFFTDWVTLYTFKGRPPEGLVKAIMDMLRKRQYVHNAVYQADNSITADIERAPFRRVAEMTVDLINVMCDGYDLAAAEYTKPWAHRYLGYVYKDIESANLVLNGYVPRDKAIDKGLVDLYPIEMVEFFASSESAQIHWTNVFAGLVNLDEPSKVDQLTYGSILHSVENRQNGDSFHFPVLEHKHNTNYR